MVLELTCDECKKEFEAHMKMRYCSSCAEEKAMASLSKIEPPEGGWPRYSDMDQI